MRTIQALKVRGYVNDSYQATTAGWHAVNELRWVPKTVVPEDWEIETWIGKTIDINESPESDYDEVGQRRWTRATDRQYFIDVYPMMKFMQKVQEAKREWLESKWSAYYDREFENDVRWHRRNTPSWLSFMEYEAHKEALNSVSSEMDLRYTGEMFYIWAWDIYTRFEVLKGNRDLKVSYKYSLQDNEDEFADWRVEIPSIQHVISIVHVTVD
jgi:hypothetical protein